MIAAMCKTTKVNSEGSQVCYPSDPKTDLSFTQVFDLITIDKSSNKVKCSYYASFQGITDAEVFVKKLKDLYEGLTPDCKVHPLAETGDNSCLLYPSVLFILRIRIIPVRAVGADVISALQRS